MDTVRLTMAQALIRYLNHQYIVRDGERHKFFKGVMGIFGHGNVTGIGQALEQAQQQGELADFTFIQGKNEQGMANAAIAYAKQQNRMQAFACTSSIGPGALNMVTAAGTATINRIPLLLLPGDVFASRQPDPVLQQLEHPLDYSISVNDAFKPVSRYWDRITRPEQLMSALNQAMRVLADPADTGAVTLCLPQDVQCEAFDYPADFFADRMHMADRRPAAQSAVHRAAALLSSKKKPVLICGGGVHYSGAAEELQQFAKATGIPVLETQAGKSAMPWTHPLAFGGVGVTGTAAANRLLHEADAVLAVGTRLADFTTESKTAFRSDADVITINIGAADAVKWQACPIVADAKEGLTALGKALNQIGYEIKYKPNKLLQMKEEWHAEVDRLYELEHKEGLAQTRALGIINSFINSEDIIVGAAGSLPGDLHRLWRCSKPKTYHMEYGFSCMGYEVAGAFGVRLAEPDREVYALVGDGSYLMLHSELVTSLQENKKITVLLFDNHGFQCIHNLQRVHGSGSFGNEFRYRQQEHLSGVYMPIDYAAYARSVGAKAYTAHTADQLAEALELAKLETTSTLIDIKVLPGTGTSGYDSWWHVGVAEVSVNNQVQQAYGKLQKKLESARRF